MAIRYSGEVKISLTYNDATSIYDCRLSWPGGRAAVTVGEPAVLTHAVDSPEAYDSAAHAAMSFAEEDGAFLNGHAEYAVKPDGSGWHIGRSKAKAWPWDCTCVSGQDTVSHSLDCDILK